MFEVLDRVWRFAFRNNIDHSIDALSERLKGYQRFILIAVIALGGAMLLTRAQIAEAARYAYYATGALVDGDRLGLNRPTLEHANAVLGRLRPQLSAQALAWVRENRSASDGFTWGVAQLVSATPAESQSFAQEYARYINRQIDRSCHCLIYDGIPHTVTLAWVLISLAQLQLDLPEGALQALLNAQSEEGWWSITLDATEAPSNAGAHTTALAAIALQSLIARGSVEGDDLLHAQAALQRARLWLARSAEDDWSQGSDYPSNARRNTGFVFGAIAAVAVRDSDFADSLRVDDLRPIEPNLHFASDAIVMRRNGREYVDRYRHLVYAWTSPGLASVYPFASFRQRVYIRRYIHEALQADLENAALRRQEWILAEVVFAQSLLLADATPSGVTFGLWF